VFAVLRKPGPQLLAWELVGLLLLQGVRGTDGSAVAAGRHRQGVRSS